MVKAPVISKSSIVFDVRGIKVKVDLLFVALLVLTAVGGHYTEVLALILALAVHEGAHLFTASSFGADVEEVTVLPFGARISLNLVEASSEAELLTVLSGPMANFTTAIFILVMYHYGVDHPVMRELIHRQLQLGFFNLMPALPLDGGRIFELWLRERTDFLFASRIAAKAGKVFAVAFFCVSAISAALGKITLSLIIPGIFLFYYATIEERQAALIFMNQVAKKKARVLKKGLWKAETLVVLETTPVKNILYLFAPQKYYIVYVVDEDLRIKKRLTETKIFEEILVRGWEICVKDIL